MQPPFPPSSPGYYGPPQYVPQPPPTRSINLGDTFKFGMKVFKARWKAFIGLGVLSQLVLVVCGGICFGVGFWLFYPSFAEFIENPVTDFAGFVDLWQMVDSQSLKMNLLFFAWTFISTCGTWWFSLAMVRVADGELTGTRRNVTEALRDGFRGLGSLAPIAAASALAIVVTTLGLSTWTTSIVIESLISGGLVEGAVGRILLITILICTISLVVSVVAVLLAIKLFVVFPVMVAEKVSVWRAFGRSWKLTSGAGGMIFLLQLLVGLIVGSVSQIALVPAYMSQFSLMFSLDSFEQNIRSPADLLTALSPMFAGLAIAMVLVLLVTMITMCFLPILSAVVYRDRLKRVTT